MQHEPIHPSIKDIIAAGGEVYQVGGVVRDHLLGYPIKDADYLIAGLPIETLATILAPHGKVAFVGKSFGVLKFSPHSAPSETWDLSIPRKEISTGVGHRDFTVQYDHTLPIEEDLGRRDFTINAMARDILTGTIIDPFNGQHDLSNRCIRQVFPNAFPEDPLRILRGIQFASRFELTIEPATLEAMRQHVGLLASVAAERVIEEVKKLLSAPVPSTGFKLMHTIGALPIIFPELADIIGIEQDKQRGDDVFMHTMRVLDATRADPEIDYDGDLELMLAALYHDVGKKQTMQFSPAHNRIVFFGHQLVSKRLARKRFNALKVQSLGVDLDNILTMIEFHMFETKSFYSDKAIRRFINKVGPDLIFKLVDLRVSDNRGGKYPKGTKGILKLKKKIVAIMSTKPPFGAKDLAITGHDIMMLGLSEGPMIGMVIKQLVECVLDQPERNTRDDLIALASDMIQSYRQSREDVSHETPTK